MKQKLHNLFVVLLVLFLIVFFHIQVFGPVDPLAPQWMLYKIEKGEGTRDIAKYLASGGLIRSGFFFQAYVFVTGVSHRLQAGEYLVSQSLSIAQIVQKFSTGDVQKSTVRFGEGWSVKDAPELTQAAGRDFSQEFHFLKDKPKSLSLEGYLFPDTYFVRSDEAAESIVRRMLQNFDKHFTPELKKETQRQNKTVFQVITMASLLEKEVPGLQDRKIVSGILWKRLKAGIALQVDATISYAKVEHTKNISKEDTQIDSPYNTYKYPGLPLGPIANPGMESILAALYPTESPYWYYLSTPEGLPGLEASKTIFSKTLEEHNIAKARYLKN